MSLYHITYHMVLDNDAKKCVIVQKFKKNVFVIFSSLDRYNSQERVVRELTKNDKDCLDLFHLLAMCIGLFHDES